MSLFEIVWTIVETLVLTIVMLGGLAVVFIVVIILAAFF